MYGNPTHKTLVVKAIGCVNIFVAKDRIGTAIYVIFWGLIIYILFLYLIVA